MKLRLLAVALLLAANTASAVNLVSTPRAPGATEACPTVMNNKAPVWFMAIFAPLLSLFE